MHIVLSIGSTSFAYGRFNVAATLLSCTKRVLGQTSFNEENINCYGKALKLNPAAPQRWHGVADVLGGIIANFDVIRALYNGREQIPYLLEVHKEGIEELYSLINPIADIIRDWQKTSKPAGVMAVLSLSALMLNTPNADNGLRFRTLFATGRAFRWQR